MYLVDTIELMYSRTTRFDSYKETLGQMVDKTELKNIGEILFGDICHRVTYFNTIEECNNFDNGITSHGLSMLQTTLLENVRQAIELYEKEKANGTANIYAVNYEIIYDSCIFAIYNSHCF